MEELPTEYNEYSGGGGGYGSDYYGAGYAYGDYYGYSYGGYTGDYVGGASTAGSANGPSRSEGSNACADVSQGGASPPTYKFGYCPGFAAAVTGEKAVEVDLCDGQTCAFCSAACCTDAKCQGALLPCGCLYTNSTSPFATALQATCDRIANIDSSEAFCASLAELATEVQSDGDCSTAVPTLLEVFGCSGVAPTPAPAPAHAKGAFLLDCALGF